MRKLVLLATVCLFTVVSLADVAFAKRIRIPFLIPGGGGSSKTIVKVLDLPDVPALERRDGTYVDLGYMFRGSAHGEWVGYVGSSRRYVKLDERMLEVLLEVAGLDQLPPVPERPASMSFSGGGSSFLVIFFILTVIGLYKLAKNIVRGGAGVSSTMRDPQPRYSADSMPHWQTARAAMAQPVRQTPAGKPRGFGRR